MNISRDHAEFDCLDGFGYTLPCDRGTSTSATGHRELAETRRKRAAEDVNTNLIEFAGSRGYQFEGDRHFAGRRIH